MYSQYPTSLVFQRWCHVPMRLLVKWGRLWLLQKIIRTRWKNSLKSISSTWWPVTWLHLTEVCRMSGWTGEYVYMCTYVYFIDVFLLHKLQRAVRTKHLISMFRGNKGHLCHEKTTMQTSWCIASALSVIHLLLCGYQGILEIS